MKVIFKIKNDHTIDLVKSYCDNKEEFLSRFVTLDRYKLDYRIKKFNEIILEYLNKVDELYSFSLSETSQAFNTILIAIEYTKNQM